MANGVLYASREGALYRSYDNYVGTHGLYEGEEQQDHQNSAQVLLCLLFVTHLPLCVTL